MCRYVHRLIESKVDGRVEELPDRSLAPDGSLVPDEVPDDDLQIEKQMDALHVHVSVCWRSDNLLFVDLVTFSEQVGSHLHGVQLPAD